MGDAQPGDGDPLNPRRAPEHISHADKRCYPFKPGGHFEIDPAHVPHEKAVPVPLHAGDMIFFDAYLLHYSDLNRSTMPRRSIIYTYNPARLGKINEGRFPADGTPLRESDKGRATS